MTVARPIFRIFDYSKTIEFYINWLGFKIDWQHQFDDNAPVYMQVSLGDLVIHLSEHHGDCSPGARVHIEGFEGLKEYHQQLLAKYYKYNRPGLKKASWDANIFTMEVTDPFGNRLTFTGR